MFPELYWRPVCSSKQQQQSSTFPPLNKSSCSVCTQRTQWELCAGKYHRVQINVFSSAWSWVFVWSEAYSDRWGSRLTASFTQIKDPAANERAERETLVLIRDSREAERGGLKLVKKKKTKKREKGEIGLKIKCGWWRARGSIFAENPFNQRKGTSKHPADTETKQQKHTRPLKI